MYVVRSVFRKALMAASRLFCSSIQAGRAPWRLTIRFINREPVSDNQLLINSLSVAMVLTQMWITCFRITNERFTVTLGNLEESSLCLSVSFLCRLSSHIPRARCIRSSTNPPQAFIPLALPFPAPSTLFPRTCLFPVNVSSSSSISSNSTS